MSLRYTLEIDATEERDLGFLTGDISRHIDLVVAGLSAGSPHQFRVKATDQAGNVGPWSELFYLMTPPYSDALLTAFDWLGYHDAEALGLPNNADVTQFTDHSGHNTDFLPVGSQPVPTFLTVSTPLNGKKAVRFGDLSATQSLRAAWNATGECTVFIVVNIPGLSNSTIYLFGEPVDSSYTLSGNTVDFSLNFVDDAVLCGSALFGSIGFGTHIIRIEHRATETRFFVDGVDLTVDATHTEKPGASVTMGYVPSWSVGMWDDVHIGFIGCSDGLITGADADTCEAVWIARYGL